MSGAYYNEIDLKAVAWLRELIKQGHIAPGEVDERSIVDVRPDDLRSFTQCHFFAGIGVWSYALRKAGWPDDRPVWTGSCPCQPFSAAGKGKGFADERHLWPAFFHLIESARPVTVFGEQVASKDGLAWLDLVQADMEGKDYAFGAVDTCAAGFGAPHIRQRLYWVADAQRQRRNERFELACDRRARDAQQDGLGGLTYGVGISDSTGSQQRRKGSAATRQGGSVEPTGCIDRMAYTKRNQEHEEQPRPAENERGRRTDEPSGCCLVDPGAAASQTNGFWRDADWLFCRDGKWRPVESGTFPLAHGASARVGRLRGYGNAINAAQAEGFITAFMEEVA